MDRTVAVSAGAEDSEAQLKGVLPGDRLVRINNTAIGLNVPHWRVATLIGQSSRPLRLVIERFPRPTWAGSSPASSLWPYSSAGRGGGGGGGGGSGRLMSRLQRGTSWEAEGEQLDAQELARRASRANKPPLQRLRHLRARAHLSAGPVCSVELPNVPIGFHATWVDAALVADADAAPVRAGL